MKRKYADKEDSEVNARRRWDFLHSINSANITGSFGRSGREIGRMTKGLCGFHGEISCARGRLTDGDRLRRARPHLIEGTETPQYHLFFTCISCVSETEIAADHFRPRCQR